MTYSSKDLQRLDQQCVWHPFTQMQDYQSVPPLIIERAEGCLLYDTEGKSYIDGISSLWVNIHGHRKAQIDQAIVEQLQKVAHSTLLGLANVPSILLAAELLKIAPANLKKVFYSDSGSTAVEIAVKMAFQYWQQQGGEFAQKTRFVTLADAYHGDTIGSVSVGGMPLFHGIFKPLLFDCFIIPDFDLGKIRQLFEQQHSEIAAFIVEPMIQGAAGMLLQPRGFLAAVRKLCDEFNILLICDEVATGFGRTGKMFAVEHENIQPDFLCVAKGITGGYLPLAATLTTPRIFEGFLGSYQDFKTFFHGHSYTGNPLACAAALANLKIFHEEKIIEQLGPKIDFLKRQLEPFRDHPNVREVRHLGMMVGIELQQKDGRAFPVEQRMAHQVCLEGRQQGILLRPLGDTLVILPPLAISEPLLEELCAKTLQSMTKIMSDL